MVAHIDSDLDKAAMRALVFFLCTSTAPRRKIRGLRATGLSLSVFRTLVKLWFTQER